MFAELYYYFNDTADGHHPRRLSCLRNRGFAGKNARSSGVKNILAFAFVIPAFYFFGWWVYWGFPTGLSFSEGPNGISGAAYAKAIAWGWGESAAFMGPNTEDQIDGVFWGTAYAVRAL